MTWKEELIENFKKQIGSLEEQIGLKQQIESLQSQIKDFNIGIDLILVFYDSEYTIEDIINNINMIIIYTDYISLSVIQKILIDIFIKCDDDNIKDCIKKKLEWDLLKCSDPDRQFNASLKYDNSLNAFVLINYFQNKGIIRYNINIKYPS